MRRMTIAIALVVCSQNALAFDSALCGENGELDKDYCEGQAAAQIPWGEDEHALFWKQTRLLANLPPELDAPFESETMSLAREYEDPVFFEELVSLQAAPFDLVERIVKRRINPAVFAQLPDKSYTLWDWVSGNEGCPPTNTDGFEDCHHYPTYVGWLNSNHMVPQSGQLFFRLHQTAIERAQNCAEMASRLSDEASAELVMACDREAMLIEAVAHHYLQDAWSIGHMWERWGSPELSDFDAAIEQDPELISTRQVAHAISRSVGLIHGAESITRTEDAMCTPVNGVDFVIGGEVLPGAGDLHLNDILSNQPNENLFAQKELMLACTTTAMREVYTAGAQSFGPMGASQIFPADLSACFDQRASNKALAMGAALQYNPLFLDLFDEEATRQRFRNVSDSYLSSIGIETDGNTLFVPLTSEILQKTSVLYLARFPSAQIVGADLEVRWEQDMRRLQLALESFAAEFPQETQLASGSLPKLLGMQTGGAYNGAATSYLDPPLPWQPQPATAPIDPRIENAGNIIARTFIDAHATDWCEVLHEEGSDEFALNALRERCQDHTLSDEVQDAACHICTKLARFGIKSHDDDALSVCEELGNDLALTVHIEGEPKDRATAWCQSPEYKYAGTFTQSEGESASSQTTVDLSVIVYPEQTTLIGFITAHTQSSTGGGGGIDVPCDMAVCPEGPGEGGGDCQGSAPNFYDEAGAPLERAPVHIDELNNTNAADISFDRDCGEGLERITIPRTFLFDSESLELKSPNGQDENGDPTYQSFNPID